jgi:hypothetical protein
LEKFLILRDYINKAFPISSQIKQEEVNEERMNERAKKKNMHICSSQYLSNVESSMSVSCERRRQGLCLHVFSGLALNNLFPSPSLPYVLFIYLF